MPTATESILVYYVPAALIGIALYMYVRAKAMERNRKLEVIRLGTRASVELTNESLEDLTRIHGIGRVLEGVLNEKGIRTFEELATLSVDDIEARSRDLRPFGNRVGRDRWIEQAQALAATKTA